MPVKKIFTQTNKGVEARNRKDIETSAQEVINGQARLEEKAKIYEALSNFQSTRLSSKKISERKRYIEREIFSRF